MEEEIIQAKLDASVAWQTNEILRCRIARMEQHKKHKKKWLAPLFIFVIALSITVGIVIGELLPR